MAEFLAGKGSDEGIRRIRRRYRVAFVEEFQDTDDLQWRMFRTLFLETFPGEPPNRLFIIGDPKQSIYGFRHADVEVFRAALADANARGQVDPVFLEQVEDLPQVLQGIVNEGDILVTMGVCTHLGCVVAWQEQAGEFLCPCHGGRFSAVGQVLGGPPPSPLETLAVELDGDQLKIG